MQSPPRTFFRRQLPCPPAVAFSSPEGRLLLTQALADQTAEGFFPLIEQFSMQDEPAYCGLASIAMVLNALRIDPLRPWKGPWRVFHEQLLDCCVPLLQVKQHGISLPQAACLSRCNGADVELILHTQCSLESFRRDLLSTCSGTSQHIIVSYSRKGLEQTGDGHFSPLGAYHKGLDHVLILDTARFKYPPHWVSLADLFSAMAATDGATGQCRGYLRIKRAPRRESTLFTLDISNQNWRQVYSFLRAQLPEVVSKLEGSETLAEAVHFMLQDAPVSALPQLLVRRALDTQTGAPDGTCCGVTHCSPPEAAHQMLQELRSLELWRLVSKGLDASASEAASLPSDVISSGGSTTAEPNATNMLADQWSAMLLLLPSATWDAVPDPVRGELCAAVELDQKASQSLPVLKSEIAYLQQQWQELPALGAA